MVSINVIGSAIALSHKDIRIMLRLAKASQNDVFYDLGCGAGLVCCLAVREFKVKRAVGIEFYKPRVRMARRLIRRYGLSHRVEIRHQKLEDADFSDASIVYYGLSEEDDTFDMFRKNLAIGCRLVTYEFPLLGIMPNAVDHPYYLSRFPFTRPRTINDWVSKVSLKKTTTEKGFEELKENPVWHDMTVSLPKWKKILNERLRSK